jgi:hypothetical protein
MTIYTKFKPTFLYVKRHSVTGKPYFGKTTKNPEKYHGSGKLWKPHIAKHGKQYIETIWYQLYYDAETIKSDALALSKSLNIVESSDWLNLIEEDGIGNGLPPGHKKSEEHKRNISISNKGQVPWCAGLKLPKEFGEKVSKSKKEKHKKLTEQEKLNISIGTKKAMNDPVIKAKCAAPHIRNWIVTKPDGQILYVTNLAQFCRDNNLGHSAMKCCAQGRRPTAYGYRVKPRN